MPCRSTGFSDYERKSGSHQSETTTAGGVEPLLVKPRVAWQLLGCSNTRGYELLRDGELESFRDGKSRKILVKSIHAYIERQLAAVATQQAAKNPTEHATAARLAKRAKGAVSSRGA